MPACPIKDQEGMRSGGDGAGDLGQAGGHCPGVDAGQHETGCGAAGRTDGTEEIGPLIAGIAGRAGSGAAPGPDAGDRALLADPCFILEPDLQRLAPCPRGDRRSYRFGEVFLNAACAPGSDFGCCGRTDSRRKPSAASCLPTLRS